MENQAEFNPVAAILAILRKMRDDNQPKPIEKSESSADHQRRKASGDPPEK